MLYAYSMLEDLLIHSYGRGQVGGLGRERQTLHGRLYYMFQERDLGFGAERGDGTMNHNLPRVAYRPREAAEVTGLSLRFLYYAIQHKDLPTVRVGRCRLITEKALREWLERRTEGSVESRA